MTEFYNPFSISGYYGPELFCDRKNETNKLVSNARNGIHTTLLSIRRMGKTGLIRHAFYSLNKKTSIHCVYVDINATKNLKDFTDQFGTAVIKAFPEQKSIGKKLMTLIKSLRPVISFDILSNSPQLSFDFAQPKQYEHSLAGIIDFLENQKCPIIIAIDEFQQVTSYPEKNTEALLRSLIQPLKNLRFVFSGSSKHLLHDIFSDTRRPFFASTQPLTIGPIETKLYTAFIRERFTSHKRKISDDAMQFIAEWSRLHTYYTQAICNHIFASGIRNITIEVVHNECNLILQEHENIFFQYRQLLTTLQWALLKSIAMEGKVYHPTSNNFINKYRIGTSANIQRTLEALLNKEMIYKERDENGTHYCVYDCFLSRWLERI